MSKGIAAETGTGKYEQLLVRCKNLNPVPTAVAHPCEVSALSGAIEAADEGLIGLRDRALILLGFAGAFRRSELVGLNCEDLIFSKDGLTVLLRRSKTETRSGRKVPRPRHPHHC